MKLLSYGYGGTFKECRGQKGNQSKIFCRKYFVRNLKNVAESILSEVRKNAENAKFWIRKGDTSIPGEKYNTWNHCRSKEKWQAPYALDGRHQKC